MELYIVRHGETIWNAEGRLQGRVDIELNAKGRALAGALGEELEALPFDCIYASPLIRAYETACLIRGHRNIPIVRDDRLKEICFGEMEGVYVSQWLDESSPYKYFFSDPEKYRAPKGGETLEEVCLRTKEFMQEIIEPAWREHERVMIVAHGALNKGLMCYLQKNTIPNYWGKGLQKNCDAAIFSYDGKVWTCEKE